MARNTNHIVTATILPAGRSAAVKCTACGYLGNVTSEAAETMMAAKHYRQYPATAFGANSTGK